MTRFERELPATRRPGRDDGAIVPTDRRSAIPLSFSQQRLWLLDQLEPTSWAYNVSVVRRLHGALELHALQSALDEIMARHEVLRTTIATSDDLPVQVVGAPGPFELTVIDLTDRALAGAEEEARRLTSVEARRWFDLANGPVFRGLLVRLSPEDHVLALTMHHIATDAWSEAVLLEEVSALYNAAVEHAPAPLTPLPIQYADFAVWQRARISGDFLDAELGYWLPRLESLPPVLELPTARPRPAKRSGRGATVDIALSAEVTTGLQRVTRAGRASLFMTLLAAFQSLLARYSGEDDIAVGTAIANRTRRETHGLIGFFANTLVLRTDLSGDPTFMEVLARVREAALGAYSHQEIPFEQLVKALAPERTLDHTALFQHMFVFQNAPGGDLDFNGVTTSDFAVDADTAMFDLTLVLSETDDGVVGTMEYATDLYDRPTAERFVRHFEQLLDAIVAAPERPIAQLDVLGAEERRKLLVEWNAQGSTTPGEWCIHQVFEAQAARDPDAVALTVDGLDLTYCEINERANRLACHLRQLGAGPDRPVGVCLPRSADAIVALLATLKAGGAYMALDPGYPPARLSFMLEDSHADIVITSKALVDRLDASPQSVVVIDADTSLIEAGSAENPDADVAPGNLAYLVYTSGSTGTPKGAMIEHRAVIALLFGVDYIRFDQVDTMLHMAPLEFDASTFEIWGALLHGKRCVVATDRHFSLERLGALLKTQRVDTLWLTSALFNVVVDEGCDHLAGVRQLIIGGEALSPSHVGRALQQHPHLRLVNGYGPTETTTFAACHEIRAGDAEAGSVPIGRPIGSTEIYVLDDRLAPVPIGVVGELFIGGPGLARGYLERPELTAARFVAHPFSPDPNVRLYRTGDLGRFRSDGNLEFVGRVDDQVKIRGFRVEPGEIEAALLEHPSIDAAAVVAREDERGHRRLVAYVVSSDRRPVPKREIRDHLRARVPDHLVPTAFVALDALPRTGNGKLDRAALPAEEPTEDEVAFEAPSTPVERAQAKIWSEVLGVERIGLDDNFFDLGGDSLQAAVLFAKTARLTGKTIPLALMFAGPTIREVAEALEEEHGQEATSIVPLRLEGSKPPLIVAHGVSGLLFRYSHLVARLDPEQPVYGLRPTPAYMAGHRRLRLEDLAGAYVDDILRVQPTGPFWLAGFCFGGIVVMEVAHQLERRGHSVGLLALFDAEPTSARPSSHPPAARSAS